MSKKKNEQILVESFRTSLKSIMQDEISKMPELIESLDSKERLNFIFKLMPFIISKVEAVPSTIGEPFSPEW